MHGPIFSRVTVDATRYKNSGTNLSQHFVVLGPKSTYKFSLNIVFNVEIIFSSSSSCSAK